MNRPRWMKVFRDLWTNRKRVILAVLSIAIGVYAIGTVSHMYLIVSRDMKRSYMTASPPDLTISTNDVFGDDLVSAVARMPQVKAVQGWRSLTYRYRLEGQDTWLPITFHVTSDFDSIQVSKVYPEKVFDPDPDRWPAPERWPPPYRQAIIERTSLLTSTIGLDRSKQGDKLIIEMPGGKQRIMPMAGLVYDLSRPPATFTMGAQAYMDFKTAEWFGEKTGYNELHVIVNADPYTQEQVAAIGNLIKERVERSGYEVLIMVSNQPGRAPLADLFDPLSLLLAVLGLLALPLSAFLVINTISAFLTQQVRQIGVMKAVGGTTFQVASLYLVMVLIFGAAALLIAMPLAAWTASEFIDFMAYFINFNLTGFQVPVEVILLELAVGLLVPLLAALHPILKGARTTVREAISNYGISQGRSERRDLVDTLVAKVHFLPRPLLLSLRNTFRRKARLALTLATLLLASAIFISVLSVRSSLFLTLNQLVKFYGFDIQMQLEQSYRMDRILNELADIPGIRAVEGWGMRGVTRLRPDGSESTDVMLLEAMPADSKLINPTLRAGRWLLPEDENAVVVSPSFIENEKDVAIGGDLTIKVAGKKTHWTVVGIVNMMDSGQMILFSNYAYYTRLLNEQDRARILLINTVDKSGPGQDLVLKAVRERFDQVGIKSSAAITLEQNRQQNALLFNILILLLMVMAILLAAVGGLGLTGLMSINVLERTREIGVMRAIGASNRSILSIFLTEGMLIGLIAWALGTLLSLPLSRILSDAVGLGIVNSRLDFAYSWGGAFLWLVIILILSFISTWAPSRDASRLTVRDVLAYE